MQLVWDIPSTCVRQTWELKTAKITVSVAEGGTNVKRLCQSPVWAPHTPKHIWRIQRAVVRVPTQCRPSSLLAWHNQASKLNCGGFLLLFCRGGGALFCLGRLCSEEPMSSPPTGRHDSAVMLGSISTKHGSPETPTSSRCSHAFKLDGCVHRTEKES